MKSSFGSHSGRSRNGRDHLSPLKETSSNASSARSSSSRTQSTLGQELTVKSVQGSLRAFSRLNKLKKKRDGTPDKPLTPSVEAAEDEQRPSSRQVLMNEEIASLAIKDEDLQRLREPHPPPERKKTPATRPVMIKKVPPPSELDKPTPRLFTVAKPAPPNAPLKPVDLSGGCGPRFGPDGKVLPYSILGSLEDYKREAVHRGELLEDFEIPKEYRVATPTVKYEKKKKPAVHPKMASVDENNALTNWQEKMLDRKRQQGYISNLLQKPDNQLVMNQADTFRKTQEDRYLLDRTIPFVDYGKGYRVGSEFWKQAEPIGNELTGLHMSLNQTDRGYPPAILHVGVPSYIKEEKGSLFSQSSSVNYPWHKSRFLAERRKQLQNVMNELDPHQPEIDDLQVIGSSQPYQAGKVDEPDVDADILRPVTTSSRPEDDPLANYPDVYPAPVFGPSLQFAGQSARWTGDDYSFKSEVGIEARVTFEAFAGERITSFLEVKNDGTTSMYYSWKKLPKSNPFNMVNAKVQRFYFNTSSGVILPGDTTKFPFVFKSPNAGVFSEQWQFETRPVVCGGAALVVTLRGVALQEDKYRRQRTELEEELAHRQTTRLIEQIMNDVIDGIKTPDRVSSPVDTYITEEEIFNKRNPGMHYDSELVRSLQGLHEEMYKKPEEEEVVADGEENMVTPPAIPEWDHSLNSLKLSILDLNEDDPRKEDLLQRLNLIVISLSFPPFSPIQQRLYTVGYQQLSDVIEHIVNTSSVLRQILGLPEKELEEDEGLLTRSESVTSADLAAISEETFSSIVEVTRAIKRVDGSNFTDSLESLVDGRDMKSSMSKSSSRSERTKSGPKKLPDAKKLGKESKPPPTKAAPSKEPTKSGGTAGKATPKKPPSRGGTVTPGVPPGERSGGHSPSSTHGGISPIPDTNPVMDTKYREKLYVQTYTLLSEMFDRMSSCFDDIKNDEDIRNLEKLNRGER